MLERLLHERFDDHPNLGEIRGRGLFWAVELVKVRATKEAYPPSFSLSELIAVRCIQLLLGVAGAHTSLAAVSLPRQWPRAVPWRRNRKSCFTAKMLAST